MKLNRAAYGLAIVAAFTATIILASTALAEGEVTTELVVDPVEATVGQVVVLTVSVTHPEGYEVDQVDLPEAWGPFEIRSQSSPQTVGNGDGTEMTTQTIEAALFSTGEFTTPDLSVPIRDAQGQTFGGSVQPVSVVVVSVLADGDEELQDIRPQASLPLPPVWPWILGVTLVVVAAAVAGWLVYRRMRSKPVEAPVPKAVVDLRSAYEIAMDELAEIEEMRLPDRGRFKEHYTMASDTLRRFLYGEHGVPAIDRTTDEIRHGLTWTPVDDEHARMVVGTLRECDLVKFARYGPEIEEARGLVGGVRHMVELTRALPPAEADSDIAAPDGEEPE